jgi:hypothetical protein
LATTEQLSCPARIPVIWVVIESWHQPSVHPWSENHVRRVLGLLATYSDGSYRRVPNSRTEDLPQALRFAAVIVDNERHS